ncbi:putative Tuberous sclerosis 1 protein like protein [Fusarium oxysporum f. sp. albedinis]|nr:putative Tuberous sclerosis 1 protein like protein [Fusarium oxysporum f. sp. albedinis]
MFSRLASFAKPAAKSASASGRTMLQVRYLSEKAVAGSKGRTMPFSAARATAPAASLPATLTIRDGPVFQGKAFGANANISGEAVFTTSLVGYPESMTDPSYRGQILTSIIFSSTSSPPTFSVLVSLSPMSLSTTAIGLPSRVSASGAPVREFPPFLALIPAPLSPTSESRALPWLGSPLEKSTMPMRMRVSLTPARSTWSSVSPPRLPSLLSPPVPLSTLL